MEEKDQKPAYSRILKNSFDRVSLSAKLGFITMCAESKNEVRQREAVIQSSKAAEKYYSDMNESLNRKENVVMLMAKVRYARFAMEYYYELAKAINNALIDNLDFEQFEEITDFNPSEMMKCLEMLDLPDENEEANVDDKNDDQDEDKENDGLFFPEIVEALRRDIIAISVSRFFDFTDLILKDNDLFMFLTGGEEKAALDIIRMIVAFNEFWPKVEPKEYGDVLGESEQWDFAKRIFAMLQGLNR